MLDDLASKAAPPESLIWLRLRVEAARVRLALKAPAAAAGAGWPLAPGLVAGLLRVAAAATAPAPAGWRGGAGGDAEDVHPSGLFRATFVAAAPVRCESHSCQVVGSWAHCGRGLRLLQIVHVLC